MEILNFYISVLLLNNKGLLNSSIIISPSYMTSCNILVQIFPLKIRSIIIILQSVFAYSSFLTHIFWDKFPFFWNTSSKILCEHLLVINTLAVWLPKEEKV